MVNASKKGFTLVEILIGIAIIAILGASTYFALNGTTDKAKVTTARDSLVEVYKALDNYNRDSSTLPVPADIAGASTTQGKVGYLSTNGSVANYLARQKVDTNHLVMVNDTQLVYATDAAASHFAVWVPVINSAGLTVMAVETNYPVAKDVDTLLGVANGAATTNLIAAGTAVKNLGYGQLTTPNSYDVFKATSATQTAVTTGGPYVVDQVISAATAGVTNDIYLRAAGSTF